MNNCLNYKEFYQNSCSSGASAVADRVENCQLTSGSRNANQENPMVVSQQPINESNAAISGNGCNYQYIDETNLDNRDYVKQEECSASSTSSYRGSSTISGHKTRIAISYCADSPSGFPSNRLAPSELGSGDMVNIGCAKTPIDKIHSFPAFLQRNAHMLFNEEMADVWFIVGYKPVDRIPAHKYVLSLGSSVFHAMFHGNFRNDVEILIPDVEPQAFRILLRYLYIDKVELKFDTVIAVLYASKKYMVGHLTKMCVNFLEDSLTADNVCLVLSERKLFDENRLLSRCWELMDAQAELALLSDGFKEIDRQTFESILLRETLTAREPIVFRSALMWAEAEAVRKGIDHPEPADKRNILGNLLHLIRIPSMKIEEFADGPAQSGLLTFEETTEVFLYFTANRKPSIPFISVPRTGLSIKRCLRFQSSAYRSNQWRYRGRCDSIEFSTDRRIFVAGYGLYGSSKGTFEYAVHIDLKGKGNEGTFTRRTTSFKTDGSSRTFPVLFEQPIKVEPGVFYTASALLDGVELSYFGQEGLPEVQCGDVTFQFQCSADSTNGTGVQGGQIPEILFYA